MGYRRVEVNWSEWVKRDSTEKIQGYKEIPHKKCKGWFLGFGTDTYENTGVTTIALIEDEQGYVHNVDINNFRFLDQPKEEK